MALYPTFAYPVPLAVIRMQCTNSYETIQFCIGVFTAPPSLMASYPNFWIFLICSIVIMCAPANIGLRWEYQPAAAREIPNGCPPHIEQPRIFVAPGTGGSGRLQCLLGWTPLKSGSQPHGVGFMVIARSLRSHGRWGPSRYRWKADKKLCNVDTATISGVVLLILNFREQLKKW